MKIDKTDIHAAYKRTKSLYITVMDRITDRRAQSSERFKELCKLAENLHYATNHLRRFL